MEFIENNAMPVAVAYSDVIVRMCWLDSRGGNLNMVIHRKLLQL